MLKVLKHYGVLRADDALVLDLDSQIRCHVGKKLIAFGPVAQTHPTPQETSEFNLDMAHTGSSHKCTSR
jgi:hypothetical protein